MVFSNLVFLYLFLPVNLLFYFLTKNLAYRNAVLIFFSLAFYAWGEPVWIILLVFSASADYFHGLLIERFRATPWAKFFLVTSTVLNLGLLGVFKYSGFIVENINLLAGLALPVPAFTLPIGISFYTFQTMSYIIDLYRGRVAVQRSYPQFLLYVSMYSQLVAGPIVRYATVARELSCRVVTARDISAGLGKFCCGLAKKVLVANEAARYVAQYLDGDLAAMSAGQLWFGVLMFTLQIYYDFSGYSDMALGLARVFGFHYEPNFNYPYIAKSLTEFWRRWHISLGAFFRDYVYIPLGGNRKYQFRNILVVWFLTGLWHGASWNFILWGLYYGAFLLLEKAFLLPLLQKPLVICRVLARVYTLFFVTIGWCLFYFTDPVRLLACLTGLFTFGANPAGNLELSIVLMNNLLWLAAAAAFCCPIVPWLGRLVDDHPDHAGAVAARFLQAGLNAALLLLCTASLVGNSYNPFLYFRF